VNQKKNIAVFSSGEGTNAEAIFKYFQQHKNINIKLLVCNNQSANVLKRASNKHIQSVVIDKNNLNDEIFFSEILAQHEIDCIVLAGFLLKIPDWLIKKFKDKILNIHPSLLPKYGGKGMFGKFVHEAVLKNEEAESGISIHFVNEHYDEGKIIFQQKIKIEKNETTDSLSKKINQLELENYAKVIEQVFS
jgi:phosphoribosylglycinamide formyltransferase 1